MAGFWDIEYTGSAFGKCQEVQHQSGSSTWGEISCTHAALGSLAATLDQETRIATGVEQFQQPAYTVAFSTTYSPDGNSSTSTWTCTVGCSGASGNATANRIPDHYETPIPASSGGELTTALNDTLTVPPDALPHDEEVTIDIHTLPVAPPEGLKPLTRAYTFGPAGLEFSTPVTVTFQYTENDLAGGSIDPSTLQVYIYISATGLWDLVGGDVDTGAKTITVQLDHFSTYSILGEPPPTPTPTITPTPTETYTPTITPTQTPNVTPTSTQSVGGNSPRVIATIGVGGSPLGVGVNTVNNRVYAGLFESRLEVIDGVANATVTAVPVGGQPHDVAVDPATSLVYVASYGSSMLWVVDGTVNTVTATPTMEADSVGVAVNTTTHVAYASNYSKGTVTVFGATVTPIPVGPGPRGVAINPTTNRIYVANAGGNSVSAIDGATHTVVGTPIPIPGWPAVVAANPLTNRIYVASYDNNTVYVINGATNDFIGTPIPVGTAPYGIAVNPSTGHVFVSNSGSDNVSVIDEGTRTVIATLPVGDGPRGGAVNPALNRFYAANQYSGSVSVIQDYAPPVGGIAEAPADADAVASSDRDAWTAKGFVIVAAAAGFVLLLVAGAFAVRRRGEA